MSRPANELEKMEEQYVLFTYETGPVQTYSKLLDFLSLRCGDKVTTRMQLVAQKSVWDELSGRPLGSKEFRRIMENVRRDQRSKVPVFLTDTQSTTLFAALSGGSELVYTRMVSALCMLFDSNVFEHSPLEFVSCDTFVNTVEEDPVLSKRLASKFDVVLSGVTGISDFNDDTLTDNANVMRRDSFVVEPWELVTADVVAATLEQIREDIQVGIASRSREQHDRTTKSSLLRKRAYFSPKVVVPTTSGVGSFDVRPFEISATKPSAAVMEFDKRLTTQAIVSRVDELRRLRRSKERNDAAVQDELVMNSTRVLTDDDLRQQERMEPLETSSLLRKGDEAVSRLFPHTLDAQLSIRAKLLSRLGLDFQETAPQPRARSVQSGPKKAFVPRQLPPKPADPGRAAADFFRSTASRRVEPNFDNKMPAYQARGGSASRRRAREPHTAHQSTANQTSSSSDALHEVALLLSDARLKLLRSS